MHLEPGLLLGDRYALQRRLAAGGMGEVWQATDTLLGRSVAVKTARPELAADPEFGPRLLTEARHAASVQHPGIAAVYDVHGECPLPYLVLELVDGRPLSHVIAEEGPLSPERTRGLLCQVARVLAAAHAAGLVHRDVKPSNLLVTADDTVKVTDFGISRAVDSASVTRTGFVVGTAQYLSPEQARGRPATPASDLYALGVVAFECLAGRRPFEGGPLEVLLAHREEPVPDLLADAPDDLRRLVSRLLDKDPARRPTAAEVVGGASEPATRALPLPAPPEERPPARRSAALPPRPSAPLPRRPAARLRRPALALAGAGVVVAALVGVALSGDDDRSPTSPASAGDEAPAADEPAPAPLPVSAVSLFHPGGSDGDRPEDVGLVLDGDPATAWTTQRYNSPQFGNLRPGVGLLLDLGEPREVREVRVGVGTPGLSVRLHAGSAPDPALLDGPPLGVSDPAPADLALPVEPVTAQYFVVWIDRLPEDGGPRYQAALSEVTLLG